MWFVIQYLLLTMQCVLYLEDIVGMLEGEVGYGDLVDERLLRHTALLPGGQQAGQIGLASGI